ncbi:MAG TPA: hypothetical protein PKM09_00070 [Bacillota bacterium]|jgi:ABC-2 type transport system permease protein|nr:hypothetical protein [Bacillota bacterium]HNY67095.1 hypothetical protein [Bacillota bacterium]HOI35825.1 hypothetical protein [Bacillota bacterium]HPU75841.1 hypothetical protein [Bacillota bacterium]
MHVILWYEVKRGLLRRARSPMEFVTESLAVYIFLVVAVFAASGRVPVPSAMATMASGGLQGRAASEAMFAFACIFCCLGAVQGASLLATEEPGTATLDQLAMSAVPLWVIGLLRDIASFVSFIPSMALIMGAVSLTTGVRFPWPAAVALAPMAMMRLAMLGIGYALGAVALLVKRVGGLVNLVSMAVFALALAPIRQLDIGLGALGIVFPYRWWYGLAADLTFGGSETAGLLARGVAWPCVALASIMTLVYFFAGLLSFNAAFRTSLRRGSLSRA